jgi:hypothetical protein
MEELNRFDHYLRDLWLVAGHPFSTVMRWTKDENGVSRDGKEKRLELHAALVRLRAKQKAWRRSAVAAEKEVSR